MAEIYITGHRNPDMDSICSALAYADLKNLIDPANTYVPVCCSHIGESTKTLLDALDITPPRRMRNVNPKVSDVMMSPPSPLDADDPLTSYALIVSETTPSAVPVFEGGKFYGLLSVDDVSLWAMRSLAEKGCLGTIPKIRDVMRTQGKPLQADDLFEDGKAALLGGKQRGLAVFDGEEFVGYVTRRCFLDTPRYNVILVDHNEAGQSIRGLETANVLEIIDHHRLNAMKTALPLFIDAEPLGSTCTIVYQLFLRNGIRPSAATARILLTGIIADTLILKSPTTTQTDVESASALAAMCRVSVEAYGRKMFSNISSLKDRDPGATIVSDFKFYTEKDLRIGIGQCEVTTLHDLGDYSAAYLEALKATAKKESLNWALVMITDVVAEHSVLLSTPFPAEEKLPWSALSEHIFDLPGVMSRKKQLLPEIINALS